MNNSTKSLSLLTMAVVGVLVACAAPANTPDAAPAGPAVPATAAAGPARAPTDPAPAAHGRKSKVIVDADMGQLNDDAVALFMLAQSDSTVDVLGVTTVAGNTWSEEGVAYSLRQLEIIKESGIPVVPGAGTPLSGDRRTTIDSEQDLWGNSQYLGSLAYARPSSYIELASPPYGGYAKTKPVTRQSASEFIAAQVKKYPHQVTLFVLGPATNIALAVRTHPEIVPLVKDVIYMGGAFDIPGNTTPAAEFNWWYDPEAIKISLRTPFPRQTVVPDDVAERVFYTRTEYDRIVGGATTPITKMFRDLQGPGFAEDPDQRSYVWDSITAAIFLDPTIATDVQTRYADVDDQFGPDYGRALGYGESSHRDLDNPEDFPAGTRKVRIVFDIDRTKFWNLVVAKLTAPVRS